MSLASSPSSSTVSSTTLDSGGGEGGGDFLKTKFAALTSALSNNCLDKCPKCGQKVCDHASIADVINLPNSISQDFSTYSSDSSLIKQFFNMGADSHSSQLHTTNNQNNSLIAQQHHHHHYNSNKRISLNQNYYLNSNFFKQHCSNNFNFNNLNMPMSLMKQTQAQAQSPAAIKNSTVPQRPLSCQFMVIDNETTDKLLRDFFDSKQTVKHEKQKNVEIPIKSEPLPSVEESKTTSAISKKKKFSTFRIFMKSHSETSSKCTKKTKKTKKAVKIKCYSKEIKWLR